MFLARDLHSLLHASCWPKGLSMQRTACRLTAANTAGIHMQCPHWPAQRRCGIYALKCDGRSHVCLSQYKHEVMDDVRISVRTALSRRSLNCRYRPSVGLWPLAGASCCDRPHVLASASFVAVQKWPHRLRRQGSVRPGAAVTPLLPPLPCRARLVPNLSAALWPPAGPPSWPVSSFFSASAQGKLPQRRAVLC